MHAGATASRNFQKGENHFCRFGEFPDWLVSRKEVPGKEVSRNAKRTGNYAANAPERATAAAFSVSSSPLVTIRV